MKIKCNLCGRPVSTEIPDDTVVRAWIECPECVEDGLAADEEEEKENLFVVRLYDGFDNIWIDVSSPVSLEEATKIWDEHTKNGTTNTDFRDIDYYQVFPADTKMLFS